MSRCQSNRQINDNFMTKTIRVKLEVFTRIEVGVGRSVGQKMVGFDKPRKTQRYGGKFNAIWLTTKYNVFVIHLLLC